MSLSFLLLSVKDFGLGDDRLQMPMFEVYSQDCSMRDRPSGLFESVCDGCSVGRSVRASGSKPEAD